MASDRLRGPNHQPGCNGSGSWFSGQGYNRVRVCPCGAEDHAPDFAVPVTECRCSLKTKLVGDGCAVCNPELARELSEPPAADDRLRTLLKWAEGWVQCSTKYGPEWRSAFRCVAGQVRFLLGEGEAEPKPSPRELAIRELEELRSWSIAQPLGNDTTRGTYNAALAHFLDEIEARLAKLREVKP